MKTPAKRGRKHWEEGMKRQKQCKEEKRRRRVNV